MLLTVVTVTKNCAATLAKTLQSVRAVKVADIEYVIVDGVSTDGSLDLIRGTGELVDRLVSEPDTGIYNAMNKGVSLARGRYVLFINGDDELIADGFPLVLKALREKSPEILCATTLVGSVKQPDEVLTANPWRLLFYNSVPHPSTFVSTQILKKTPFREDLRIASDYDFFLRAFLARRHFYIIDAPTALHHRGGASHDVQRAPQEIQRIRRDRLGFYCALLDALQVTYRSLKNLQSLVWKK